MKNPACVCRYSLHKALSAATDAPGLCSPARPKGYKKVCIASGQGLIVNEQQGRVWSTWMAAAQAGDAEAYVRLLHAILPFVRILIRRQIDNGDRVEDVLQDVLLTLHRVRHTYDPARPFAPWLAAITYRRAVDAQRRDIRLKTWEQELPDLPEIHGDPVTPDFTETPERSALLRQAISGLPPKQRTALELVKLQELSVAEAALRSGQSAGSVKVNIHRAVHALRRILRARPT